VLRRTLCCIALLVGLSGAQAAETRLTLACQGTATLAAENAKPESVSMGIVVDFTNQTIQGFGTPGHPSDFPLKITGMNEVTISFGGSSRVLAADWSINGTIDRVTGDVEASSIQTNVKTTIVISWLSYALKCRPTQRMF
jgi:hypothetical protein